MIDSTCMRVHQHSATGKTYGSPRQDAVCVWRSEQSAKTYPAFRREVVGQDGDPRVLVLIRGPASSAILTARVPEHRSTVRPSSTHLPQTSSSRRRARRPMLFRPLVQPVR